MVYCNTGDIARITFPDNSTQDFTDTPITVSCNPDTTNCAEFTITFLCDYIQAGVNFTSRTLSFTGKYPYGGWRTGDGLVEVSNALYFCPSIEQGWDSISGNINRFIYNASLIGIVPSSFKLSVYGAVGGLLYEENFSTCDYEVECIEGCPPDHLDCGDCCLDCEDVLSKVCNIKNLFIG
ncbi:hypothetical protein H6G54_00775 [Anabaena cylindrica FACHB-243]|uniref:Uncharacterized protein n=1 Tax=Anabaena cylindrica (strain ATCC 27899 / PCC 7122) TaxID=272123 RepID=K9ZJK3_ANACC|nr:MULTISPECIES: hypothetical protein [Anabaena]AFZ59386.1 hypothetical protein Anacy_4016 [Anabaena cylindrica PCC 7122]MBD2416270.1 hypothetical protein [Anabaena cylindrica FACHB-243]MBY5280232.1 hypothetical protein [Anabaena sp. CCAP 1446/1C]MBY5308504.1 hypothetical protein [Anabaena sp. CCAP 1446/1C]MCM2405304.1 hypothetical protein [Anabaena sp. CCAP 1446/1C]